MRYSIRMRADRDAEDCERILRSLPEWFGIEKAIVRYAADLARMETIVAEASDGIVGFLTIKRHGPASAEIHVMGVRPDLHGHGVGRGLVEAAETLLRAEAVEFLQVKTLGPSRPNEHYARTRGFYLRLGFRLLEENDLWGDVNPCLILVKHLSCSR